MKKLFSILTALLCLLAQSLHAQLIVEDPVSIAQDAVNEVLDLAKYVEMVNNQVQQINNAVATLRQVEHYVEVFGDPSQVTNLLGIDELTSDLQNSGVGKTLSELQQLAQGVEALQSNAEGLYSSVGESFSTPRGTSVPRAEDLYKKFAAIDGTAGNFNRVYDDVATRQQALRSQLADTTQQLQSSSTDAETQKLSGVVAGQAAELQALDQEVGFAASQTLIQDVQNRNDAEKQRQARSEEGQAEFSEAMTNYQTTFTLTAEPPRFQSKSNSQQ